MNGINMGKTKVKDIFGILKGRIKKDTDELMKEVDEELWDVNKED